MTSAPIEDPIVKSTNEKTIAIAWMATILFSSFPIIVVQDLLRRDAGWLFGARILLLVLGLAASFAFHAVYPLRRFLIVVLVLYSAEWAAFQWLARSAGWSHLVTGSFVRSMTGSQILKLSVALLMVAAVVALEGSRRASFLTRGASGAMARPEWFLPIRRPVPYTRFGPALAFVMGGGTLGFLVCSAHLSFSALRLAAPLIPAVLLWAAINAFSEEYSYRASLLATLRTAVGDRQALWLTSVFFGIAHFGGIPSGVLGVLMATGLGYVLGKAMLESEGILWPWFIHFIQDAVIFLFVVLGAVTTGGR